MPPTIDIPTDPKAAFEAGRKLGWESGWKAGWTDGAKHGIDHKRSIISLQDEIQLPMDFADYSDEYEREVIASIVRTPEYEHYFRSNMAKQAMLKHRQARLYDDPAQMKMMHVIGNHILDLIVFYDNAGSTQGTVVRPVRHGFDTILSDD